MTMNKILEINKIALTLLFTKFRALQFKTFAIIAGIALFFLWSGINRNIKFIFILVIAFAVVYTIFLLRVLFEILYQEICNKLFNKGETQNTSDKPKNKLKELYYFQEHLKQIKKGKKEIQFVTGVDENGKFLVFDLVELSNCFIVGMQGGGKSNLLNVVIQSMMYFNNNIFYILVDFKSVELCQYEEFKNTFFIEKLDNKFFQKLEELEEEMDSRYQKLKKAKVKNIKQYNQKTTENIPYIVLIIDEMSDIGLLKNTELKDSVEGILTRIANKGRASGIIIIGATQRPSGTQINTNIRDRLNTKFSARIKDKRTQLMAGIKGTENLKNGEFLMEYIEDVTKFKAFFINEITHNKVYENLSKKLSGGVNLDKNN